MQTLAISQNQTALTPAVESAIIQALQGLAYGSLVITVHDSRVVEIECRKKIRFSNTGAREA